jgi:hypothetical protein
VKRPPPFGARANRTNRGTVPAAGAVTLILAACSSNDQSVPTTRHGATADHFAVCPPGLEATFESIRNNIFELSCGTSGSICHSAEGGTDSGQHILAGDAYAAFLGADGVGELASNISGSVRGVRRVVPGDPDHSFLVVKLGTKTLDDPMYGAGMPRPDPGSVCPTAMTAIREWIGAGAKR